MIQRQLEAEIKQWLHKEKILIIKGPRQVGKSTLLHKIQSDLKSEGLACFSFSMDRYDDLERAQDPYAFVEYLKDKGFDPNASQKQFLFIDEFQYIKEAGRFLKILFDEHKSCLQILVSGSSSLEISKNSEYLTGRKIEFEMSSLSFFEIYKHKDLKTEFNKISLSDNQKLESFYSNHKKNLDFSFFDHIKWGGYPEAFLEEEVGLKKEIIKDITNTYLRKDIASFLKLQNVLVFNDLIQVLASQIGSLMNKSELSNTLSLNKATLDNYLDILEGTYVYSFLRPYASNLRKTLTKMKKPYISDFGLQKTVLNYFPQDANLIQGSEVENFAYQELKRLYGAEAIQFYRTSSGSEIDFVVDADIGIELFEVKYSSSLNDKSKLPLAMRRFREDVLAEETSLKKVTRSFMITKDYLRIDHEAQEYWIPAALLPFVDLN